MVLRYFQQLVDKHMDTQGPGSQQSWAVMGGSGGGHQHWMLGCFKNPAEDRWFHQYWQECVWSFYLLNSTPGSVNILKLITRDEAFSFILRSEPIKNICIPMFIATLFTIAKMWKQSKYPLTDKWIEKKWHIYAMEYCLATKKSEIFLFVTTWMHLESTMLSEVSQRKTNTIWFHLYVKSKEQRKRTKQK